MQPVSAASPGIGPARASAPFSSLVQPPTSVGLAPTAALADTASRTAEEVARGLAIEGSGDHVAAAQAFGRALEAAATDPERVIASIRLAISAMNRSDLSQAEEWARSAERISHGMADRGRASTLCAEAMNVRVGVHQLRGEYVRAETVALDALQLTTNPRVQGLLWQNLGSVASLQQRYARAHACWAQAIECFDMAGYLFGVASNLINRGAAALDQGLWDEAISWSVKGERIATREVRDLNLAMSAVMNHAEALIGKGELDGAMAMIGDAFGHFTSGHNKIRQAECLEVMGLLYLARGGPDDLATAERCLQIAKTLSAEGEASAHVLRIKGRLARIAHPAIDPLGPPSPTEQHNRAD